MSFELEQIVGAVTRADGFVDGPVRVGRQGAAIVSDAHSRFYEPVSRGQVFTLTLGATTTGVAAGNIAAAGAAAITQFALVNPLTSGKNFAILKFGLGIISGTPGPGPVFHSYITNIASLTAASPGGVIRSNILGGNAASVATPWALAAGSALTGSTQPAVSHSIANFTSTATAQASVGEINAIDLVDGALIIPPGVAWLPSWSAAGTTVLNSYGVTWEEVPV